MPDEKKKKEPWGGKRADVRNFTHEQLSAFARMGQAKSTEVQNYKRSLRKAAQILLWHPLKRVPEESEIVLTMRQMGIDDPTGADAVMLAQYIKARRGDTDAARFIRDTAGEKPSQQVEVNLLDKPLDSIDFASLDDAQLEALAAARNMTLIAGPVIESTVAADDPDLQRMPKPEGLLWDPKDEIDFAKELEHPKQKPGPKKMSEQERAKKRARKLAEVSEATPEELAERRERMAIWQAEREPKLEEKRKEKAEKKAKEEAEYKAALEERFGTSEP
jgi:hypothetical protein